MKKRVVITGVSAITPIGIDINEFWQNSLAGKSGCKKITQFAIPAGFGSTAGIIDLYDETFFDLESPVPDEDRLFKFATLAIKEALSMAGLIDENGKVLASYQKDISVYLATAIGPMISMEKIFVNQVLRGKKTETCKLENFSFSEVSRHFSKKFALAGEHLTLPMGCVGGCDALSYGFQEIRSGRKKCAVVGASEAPITPLVIASFGRIGANSIRDCTPTEASCPFDLRRDGFVLAEGAGILILEDAEFAEARGRRILAEIKGSSSVNSAYHMTDISEDGEDIARSCNLALQDAEIDINNIQYISAHGSSTVQNDLAESNAFKKVFGKNIKDIFVSSLKSQIGHALAAANVIEMVGAVCSIESGQIQPTLNLVSQDPRCNLNIPSTAVECNIENILKTSSGFSGIHSAVVLGKYR